MKKLNSKCESLEKQLAEFVRENEKPRETNENSDSIQTTDTSDSCSNDACHEDDDEHRFECNRCKKLFHYGCTNMPTYQIAHFLTPNYRRYICINCTVVPEYITEIMKQKGNLQSTGSEKTNRLIEELKVKSTEIDRVNDLMAHHQNENRRFRERIRSLESDETVQNNKLTQQGALINHLRAQLTKKPVEKLSKAPKNLETVQEDPLDAKFEAFSSNILSQK